MLVLQVMSKNRIIVRQNEHARVIAMYLEEKTDREMFDFDSRVVAYLEDYMRFYKEHVLPDKSNYLEAKELAYNEVFALIDKDESKEGFESLFGE